MSTQQAALVFTPMVEITQSAVDTFLTCKQKYVLRYLMRLAPATTAVHFILGTAFHKAMETIYQPVKGSKAKGYRKRVPQAIATINQFFDKAVESGDPLTNTDKLEYARTQCLAMFKAWMIINGGEWEEKHLSIRASELNIRATTTSINDPLAYRLAGKIDSVVDATIDGKTGTYILDRKTKAASRRGMDFAQGLMLNHQMLFYAILYEAYYNRNDPRRNVRKKAANGFYYDVTIKPLHRSGATQDELCGRMVDAMVQDPDKYFSFTPIDYTEDMLKAAWTNIRRIVAEMDALTPANVTMSTNRCNDYGGCPYLPLCREGAHVSNPNSVYSLPQIAQYKETDIHIELQEGED